jgi:polar amino acid transport system substrate-binding protein
MRNKYFSIAIASFVLGILGATVARADVLDDIKKKGTLVVGTKADYRPFGFLDPSGKIVGFEPELAGDVAKRLGVKLELVPVVASNRIQFLQQGKIDIMIATMSDTPERRKIVDIVDPSYYGSGTNILSPKSAGLKTWEALRGKKVCLIQGAFYNKELQEKYGVDGVAFPGTAEAYAALKNGNCVAFAYDDTAIVGEMQFPGVSRPSRARRAWPTCCRRPSPNGTRRVLFRGSKRSGASSPPSLRRNRATSTNKKPVAARAGR